MNGIIIRSINLIVARTTIDLRVMTSDCDYIIAGIAVNSPGIPVRNRNIIDASTTINVVIAIIDLNDVIVTVLTINMIMDTCNCYIIATITSIKINIAAALNIEEIITACIGSNRPRPSFYRYSRGRRINIDVISTREAEIS